MVIEDNTSQFTKFGVLNPIILKYITVMNVKTCLPTGRKDALQAIFMCCMQNFIAHGKCFSK